MKKEQNNKTKKQAIGIMKPVHISKELAQVIGEGPMPRTEVPKKLWVYIKEHKLQDKQDKRTIIPDAKLAAVFGSRDAISMFKMTSKVSKHLKPAHS